jgi:drug/metabolite transporter (DMT)-like permease
MQKIIANPSGMQMDAAAPVVTGSVQIAASAPAAGAQAALVAKNQQVASQPLKAIGLMCLAWALFAGIDVSAKYLTTVSGLPMPQIVWSRFFGQFVVIILMMGLTSLPRLLASQKPMLQVGRSLLLLGSTIGNFIALKYLRMDQTTTIAFLNPLVVALLAGPLLGEWVGWRRMVAILVGFCGILVAVRPGFVEVHPAFLFAFASMSCYAVFSLLTRHLSPYDPTEVTLFYSLFAGTFLMAPFAWAAWVTPPDQMALLVLCTMGVWAGAGHYLFIVAHRYAPAAVIAPFVYIALLTHSGAGYLVFGHVPDAWTLAGAAIVIASGLYLIHRERVRAVGVAAT